MDLNQFDRANLGLKVKRFDWKQLGMLVVAGAVGGVMTLSGWLWLGPETTVPGNNTAAADSTIQPGGGSTLVQNSPTVESAVKQVLPAVVAITSKDKVQSFFGGTYTQTGGGSGFVVRQDGLVVTNKHVVSSTTATYTVTTSAGKTYSASVVSRDPAADLALIKINASNLTVASLGDSSKLSLGQDVIAIGNTLGEYQNTVTTGVISGLNRSITAGNGYGSSESLTGMIQTDAAINPGNSGGPLINLSGEVVGINTAIDAQGQSVGFAIPINSVRSQIQIVAAGGTISRPQLGVRYVPVTADLATANKLSAKTGALVVHGRGIGDVAVTAGGPADLAGIKEGDIIVSINGEKIIETNDLGTVIQKYKPGDSVAVVLNRQGQVKTVSVRLGTM